MGEMAGWQGGREQGDEGALSNDSNVTTSQLQGSASERSFVVVVAALRRCGSSLVRSLVRSLLRSLVRSLLR